MQPIQMVNYPQPQSVHSNQTFPMNIQLPEHQHQIDQNNFFHNQNHNNQLVNKKKHKKHKNPAAVMGMGGILNNARNGPPPGGETTFSSPAGTAGTFPIYNEDGTI